jgi:hypothetical protein
VMLYVMSPLLMAFANANHFLSWQAKKRQLIEQRLQAKLRKETDSVRRAEDAKKDKTSANRKEEDLQLKDSIVCLHLWP